MHANAAESDASSSTTRASATGDFGPQNAPRKRFRRASCGGCHANTARLNSQGLEGDDSARLCALSVAFDGSHGTHASICSSFADECGREQKADCGDAPANDSKERTSRSIESLSRDDMQQFKGHSIENIDQRLDAFDESYPMTTECNKINYCSRINPKEVISFAENPRGNGATTSDAMQPTRPLKIHNHERHNPDDLKFKCAEPPPEDASGGSTETDKDPWTMVSWVMVCVSAVARAWTARRLLVAAAAAALLACGDAAPVSHLAKRDADIDVKTQSYLMRFGYLPQSSIEVGNLIMEDELINAVRNLQAFAGIPETGEMDEATKELLIKRRCGRPDKEEYSPSNGGRYKRFVVQGAKWNHTDLTWSLSSARRPSALDAGHTRTVLSRALSVWSQHSRLVFREVNSDQADIVVSFSRGYHDDAYPFDGRGHILAHAFFPGSGRGGDAHFDDDEMWVLQPKDKDEEGTSLFAVAAHEFGHSLGLSHSSVKGALMYPWYQGILPDFTLTADDRNGIQQMYGPRERRVWGRIPTSYTPPTTTTTTTTTTTRHPHYRHRDRERERERYHPQAPTYPRTEGPAYTPRRPVYPYDPDRRRYYNTTEYNPRPRYEPRTPPTTTTTTAPPTTTRWTRRPEYPRVPQYPYPTKPEYPRKPATKKPVYPESAPPPPRPTQPTNKPDTCNTTYDAVTLIRGEVFIFKDKWHWRIGSRGLYHGYPIEIHRMWRELPHDLTHVDAVYERPDRKIAFFVGNQYYLFDADRLMYGYPKPLTHLALPPTLERLDAAMVWGHNGKTYFYSGTMYWKYDEDEGRVELDYPRDMSMWKGVGYNIDSVFQWKDGKTYFFKGKGFWKFNDLKMRVEKQRQVASGPFWMGCPPVRSAVGNKQPYNAEPPAPTRTLLAASAAPAAPAAAAAALLLALLASLTMSFNVT